MRFLTRLLRPDRRRLIVALALSSLIYFGYLGTYAFAENGSQVPVIYRWLWPLTILAWPGWVMLFGPLAWLSKTLVGTDQWVWQMGANPTGLVFSYVAASIGVLVLDRWRPRGAGSRLQEPRSE